MAGPLMRYIAGLRGATNVSYQPNGTVRKKNEAPTRMNDAKTYDVVLGIITNGGAKVKLDHIRNGFVEAGFAPSGIGTVITGLIKQKLIRRLGHGTYTAVKALPAPKKEK